MSSARFSDDRKEVMIECNHGHKEGTLVLKHLDGNESNPDRILIKFVLQDVSNVNAQIMTSNHLIIDKGSTKILSHVFRDVSNLMEEWYQLEPTAISRNGKPLRWIPGYYEEIADEQ